MSDLTRRTISALKFLEISPKKRFGQNFMINEKTLEALVDTLQIEPSDTVLEIGPGLGFLTEYLIQKKIPVLLVEKDRVLAERLSQQLAGKVRLSVNDILSVDPAKEFSVASPIKLIGNIPYNITSPIIEWIITHKRLVKRAVLTVQWEVAQRLEAKPGGKDWGVLSAYAQYHARIRLVRKIPRSHFMPAPNVDSAIICLDFEEKPLIEVKNEEIFLKIIRLSFQKRRKTLLNSLRDVYPKEDLVKAFEKSGIDPTRRPETLTLLEWSKLASNLS